MSFSEVSVESTRSVPARSRAVRVVATERGAMILFPGGSLELRPLCRGAMEWLGSDEQLRPLVRCSQA